MRAHVVVSGRVQGVGFRAFTQQQAYNRALEGWVRNLDNGHVEIEVEGACGEIEDFVSALKHGPPFSHVVRVEVAWITPRASGTDFQVWF